jgi:hypothetical protein
MEPTPHTALQSDQVLFLYDAPSKVPLSNFLATLTIRARRLPADRPTCRPAIVESHL